VRFYEKHGYVENPCYPNTSGAHVTPETVAAKADKAKQFTEEAATFLHVAAEFIKFPKGKIPESMLVDNNR
jgi:hypothetical protein